MTVTLGTYQLTLGDVRTRVKSVVKEDDIDDLIDSRINDSVQLICREILPSALLAPPKTYTWTTSESAPTQAIPDKVMKIASITSLDDDRRSVWQTTPTELLQKHRCYPMNNDTPYYFAEVGRNFDPSLTSWFDNTLNNRVIIFDTVFPVTNFEVLYYVDHYKLIEDTSVIHLDPSYHSLVTDGALLELAEYTGETVAEFEKKMRRFERRLRQAQKRMNDQFAMSVVKGSGYMSHEVDRIREIPRATGPRFP